jgi:nucleotide-binding universal stress UspA family protein
MMERLPIEDAAMETTALAGAALAAADARYALSEPPRRGPIIVATDASLAADSALLLGVALGARAGVPVRALSVVDALVVPGDQAPAYPDPSRADQARKADRVRAVRDQVRKAVGERAECQIEVHVGPPARTIARVAAECDARLIVVGLGRHRLRDRIAGRETALQLTRLADVPVLAVPPGMTDLPSRVVIATDFSEFSARAARGSLDVLEDGALIFLAHAEPRFGVAVPGWESWGPDRDELVATAFMQLRRSLRLPDGALVEDVTLRGDAAEAVLEFARDSGADLVVAGSHGHDFFERLVIGSVSTKLVRGAHCAVLVVPPARAR